MAAVDCIGHVALGEEVINQPLVVKQLPVERAISGHLGETSLLTETDLASGARQTIVDWPALNYDPAYSPDGTEIAFASNITGEYAIYRQRLSDGKSWRVTHGKGDARYPDYRPDR